MGHLGAAEAELLEAVLELLELREALDDDCHIRVVGHAGRSRVQQQLRNQRTHDGKGNAKGAQLAIEVRDDG
jgi:hypothetical protein